MDKNLFSEVSNQLKKMLLGPDEFTIVFTGDSITHGAIHTKGYRSFVEHFNERIRGEFVDRYFKRDNFVINTGVSGAFSTDILNFFYKRIEVFKPKIVILLIGMNDCANNKVPLTLFKNNVKAIINKIRTIGALPVLQTSNTINPPGNRVTLPQYMNAIREISISESIPLIDHYKYWEEQQSIDNTLPNKWLNDAIHPNALGHLIMAKKIFENVGLTTPNSYTCNLTYPIKFSGDFSRYVATLEYPSYREFNNITPFISYKVNREFMANEYIVKKGDLDKLKSLSRGTLVARFNLTSSENANTIFSLSNSKVDSTNATLSINSGAIHFSIRNNGIFTTNIDTTKKGYNDGLWHTVVIDVTSSGTNIYIDGEKIHTNSSSGFFSILSSANTISIGRNVDKKTEGEWYYNGAISYINFYNNNLTPTQCLTLSNENKIANLTDIRNVLTSNNSGAWIFIGNNVTAGKDTTYGYRNYVEYVEERIRSELVNATITSREKFMINTSSKGITSIEVLSDFHNLIAQYNPKVVFLMLGQNERVTPILFRNNLNNIINKIQALNSVIVLQTPVFICENIVDYINIIKEIANNRKIPLINHYDYWFNLQQIQPHLRNSWLNDTPEPNHIGQLEIAKKIFRDLDIFSPNSFICNFTLPTSSDNIQILNRDLNSTIQLAYSIYKNSNKLFLSNEQRLVKSEFLKTIKHCKKLQALGVTDFIVLTKSWKNLHLAINEFLDIISET